MVALYGSCIIQVLLAGTLVFFIFATKSTVEIPALLGIGLDIYLLYTCSSAYHFSLLLCFSFVSYIPISFYPSHPIISRAVRAHDRAATRLDPASRDRIPSSFAFLQRHQTIGRLAF